MARIDPKNRSRYWWDKRIQGLSLMCADFTSHDYPPHRHEALVIAVTEQGGSIIKSRGAVEEANPSELFVFNPAEPHSAWMGCSRHWRYRALYLTQSAIGEVARGIGIDAAPYFTRNMFADGDLIEGFLALHRALEQGRDAFRERELLIDSFGRLFQRHGSSERRIEAPPRDHAALWKAFALMRERYAEPLRLEDLAAAVGLTIFQLISLFKRATGLTTHAYLTQIRLNAACRHLRRGMHLAEVAPATGFYDQSALTNTFKRCYGITPLQFATAARA